MIIYALHAICRAINRTRVGKSNSPTVYTIYYTQYPPSDYSIQRLSDYSNLGMHNSLQINGLRQLWLCHTHKMLGKYVQGWRPKYIQPTGYQVWQDRGRSCGKINWNWNKNVPRTMQKLWLIAHLKCRMRRMLQLATIARPIPSTYCPWCMAFSHTKEVSITASNGYRLPATACQCQKAQSRY